MMEITLEEKKILLSTARSSIFSALNGKKPAPVDYKNHPLFNSHCGAFVTLTIRHRLRGCIGYIISDKPLIKTIEETAQLAAFDDPRFGPLTEIEFQNIHIEISVLSEPFPMNGYDDIVIGKHGLILEEKGRRGLLLPQVPVEHNMNREEYLDAICEKAGFPAGYWKTKQLKINLFTADVFSESEME
jgi:AmmeMemoRadiSam system protein A